MSVVTSSIVVALTIVFAAISSYSPPSVNVVAAFVVVAPARIGTRRGLIDDVREALWR